ncbi:hypothetical protein [Mangrovihabitans endophyticus]|uniref:Uncharacterized protein n=1 Tax=Mangrovihabitans endophyticus TaxID=1751298 RepID=A0A8J3FMW0_9ACTN|nr:hypothetical protein [Mangrovihabitans endophyticus]GGK76388.1 hypothetical protein GCM10012284_07900 [Mangrovihabitans endophyticus]
MHPAGTIVRFRDVRIAVVLCGAQSGRTRIDPNGRRIRAAFDANAARFERTFLDALNGRPVERIPGVPIDIHDLL